MKILFCVILASIISHNITFKAVLKLFKIKELNYKNIHICYGLTAIAPMKLNETRSMENSEQAL